MNTKLFAVILLVIIAGGLGAGFFLWNTQFKPTNPGDGTGEDPDPTTVVAVWGRTSTPLSLIIDIFVDSPGYIKSITTSVRDGGWGIPVPVFTGNVGTVTCTKADMYSYYVDITLTYWNGLQSITITKSYLVPISNPPKP